MDAACHETNDMTRTAKSCGPGAPTLALSERNDPLMTVAKEPGHRGEREGNRYNHSRGEGRLFRLYLWFCRVLFCCTRTMGVSRHPAFPAPS
jgi:hypothetical protein